MAKSFKPSKYRGRPIWAVDAETDPFRKGRVPKPFIWGVETDRPDFVPGDIPGCITEPRNMPTNYLEFTDTEALVLFLCEHDVICYAHNGGKFDWHFITDWIEDYEPLTIIAGRLAKFKIGMCEFRDSYNIIPSPLSAYQKDEIDYCLFEEGEREKPENWEKITAYLRSDCRYLREMIMQFVDAYGMALTQASAAMKVWAKMSGVEKPQSSDAYYADLSRYYYGGRVQCFQTGIIEQPFSVVDIRSAYPFAMMHKHPWGGNFSILDNLPKEYSDDEISRCFLTIRASCLGAFPIRTETGLAFPSDGEIRELHITGWEYLAARDTDTLKNCEIIEVRKYYDDIDFVGYVEYFYDLKNTADINMKSSAGQEQSYWAAQRLFAKLFLNSLYGKFASNPENYEEFMTIPANFIDGACSDGWNYCKLLTEETAVVNKPLEEEKRRYYDVAVAASITGFVRAYLWRNICATSGTTIYCDTDSIAATDISAINCADGLGNWELEAECDYAAVAGKKLYAFRKLNGAWKTASKGVRLEPADIIAIAQGATITYEPEAPTFSVKGGIKFTPRRVKMLDA
jgi:hypothetical protein